MPELGDLIEIFRGLYQHWAVYVGGGFVVHFVQEGGSGFSSSSSSSGSGSGKAAFVRKEKLQRVVGTSRWKVSNKLDHKYTPRSPEKIVREARANVDQKRSYSLFTYNCEHFANEMRYGEQESGQADLMNAAGPIAQPVRGLAKMFTWN
ncbi:phospholipase A and acyltransferase 4-like [Leuresthes tenuis]|uniref:phospholipase A and acyltransferase 4-like n=1 Tax=Leuresthes tenuis TaxID=355514 RepID=UPI003B513FEC